MFLGVLLGRDEHALDFLYDFYRIDGFDEVEIEAALRSLPTIMLVIEARHRNRRCRLLGF
jgi:hypothetical protein